MEKLIEKTLQTRCGQIHYWVSSEFAADRPTLVMLPGLTADHRLFDKQVEYFIDKANIVLWDAPAHAASRPFEMDFSLKDKAAWLHEILEREGVKKPILVGQSMGGYVSQVFMQEYPSEAGAFVSIDSSTLKKKYYPGWELWLLHHTEPMYRVYPWKALLREGANGTAETPYGRQMMTTMMEEYSSDPREYCRLVGHGYNMLANAIEADLPYEIDCPCVLICGSRDRAGDTRSFNKKWSKGEGLPIEWIDGAGHNSNTDCPEQVNAIIERFLKR